MKEQTFVSEWRDGGSSPEQFCKERSDFISEYSATKPMRIEVLEKSEVSRNSGGTTQWPFKWVQYQYTCKLKVMTEPIYSRLPASKCGTVGK